ncbi:MAG: RES family NAD+ phosphorylase [SAR324 cluster bacterium]|nr:RES family NAD+ phosphorylase [SAR324 cluster bacterium]
MDELFDAKTKNIKQNVYRNITSIQVSEDLFSDLTDGDKKLHQIAQDAEMKVKEHIPPGIINRGFHYSTSIEYPFKKDNWMESRYSDASFPVWYGCIEEQTTISETLYHMIQKEGAIEGIDEIIIRHRAMYQTHCQAVLIDLAGKENDYPKLISDDYSLTQQIGKRVHHEGHPGLLVPSARYSGTNVVIFRKEVLSNSKLIYYLAYQYDPRTQSVTVVRQDSVEQILSLDDLRR